MKTPPVPSPLTPVETPKRPPRLRALLAVAATALVPWLPLPAGTEAAGLTRLNVTGSWSGNFWGGTELQISQDGDRVWGKFTYGNGDGFARGSWRDGRLILILTPTEARVGSACDPRKILVLSTKGTATSLSPYFLDLGNNQSGTGRLSRSSPNPGPPIDYPFEAELKNCGQLATYELTFATGSDELEGTRWPILDAIAELLKKEPSLKIQIAGHTDSTGSNEANQRLSERRAAAVKKVLAERYHVDAARLTVKGFGSEQPLASDDTEEGRAISRRVELVKE